ncbi:hypothetical protein RM545_09595 [Zunongwangia sp. F260]|uniref:Uncharacterized protein n=1 Tax=Autumnicola lenta TaxID=3075593 RepID=A0ABU3CKR3_9FLAO|nr:hypothetical protein [Zunongwangia sp. F260]MDT0646944.1 hypothetical protein [Zunongwangia sp. F260]
MQKKYLFAIPLALLPLLFILNPDLNKHQSEYRELFLNTAAQASVQNSDARPIFDGLDHALTTRMKITDYHFCSISYIKSTQTQKLHVIGLGILGSVFQLSSPKDLRFYFYRNKRLTDEFDSYSLKKGEESPFGWRIVANRKTLKWLGIF